MHIYWLQIFALDPVVKTPNCLARKKAPYICNVSSQRNNLIKFSHFSHHAWIQKVLSEISFFLFFR